MLTSEFGPSQIGTYKLGPTWDHTNSDRNKFPQIIQIRPANHANSAPDLMRFVLTDILKEKLFLFHHYYSQIYK